MSGFVVWFTGLSGAGKSTLAALLASELRHRGVHVEVLDGDEVRTHLSKGLTFSKEDRDTNVRRVGFVAKLVARSGACAMTAAISPYRALRDEQRAQIGRFVEVYCQCSIEALTERDVKGLYKKALAGEIKNFTGITDPYEPPLAPEVTVFSDAESKEQSLARILQRLEELGYVDAAATGRGVRTATLPLPHGGELIDRFAQSHEREAIEARIQGLPAIPLDERTESDLEMIATGAYSPLKGFMTSKDYLRVIRDMRLENGLVWSIPVTLAVHEPVAETLSTGKEAALVTRDGRRVAVIEITDVWTPDREAEALHVYRTTSDEHPGVARLRAGGPVYVGGEVKVLERPLAPAFPGHHLDPKESRALFESRGWRKVVGFQTRNPMHRAHEYITKTALEVTDGLFLHPTVGATRAGDTPAGVRMRCYEALLERYYPKDRVALATCPEAMRLAGPREAVFHALVRKNYGASHFIVGRDHAGVGGFYGAHDAQRIFDDFAPGELGVHPLCVEDAFYSTAVSGMATAKTAPQGPGTRVELSGTRVREMLARGEMPPEEVVRPEVARLLIDAARHD